MSGPLSALRIFDANLNRASEGLRVAEDVARFHWNLPGLASELKDLRHQLLQAGKRAGREQSALIEARNIEGDVGRRGGGAPPPAADQDATLLPLAEVAVRNLARVREAIRTLEETCRAVEPTLVRRFEALRYRLYSVEKGLRTLATPRPRSGDLDRASLYLLATESLCRKPFPEAVEEALAAGVAAVQLREKALSDKELLGRARWLREVSARCGALLIVNDRPDVALLSHADGLHLGQNDLPIHEARTLVGERLLIGVSTHSLEEARRAVREGADYVGVGPLFPTSTKDVGQLLGPDGLGQVLTELSIPAFAIGGIREENLDFVIAAGGRRVAVSSGILSSPDITGTVRRIVARLRGPAHPEASARP